MTHVGHGILYPLVHVPGATCADAAEWKDAVRPGQAQIQCDGKPGPVP